MKRRFTYLLTALALLAFLSPTTAWGSVKLADMQQITQKTAPETMLATPDEGMTRGEASITFSEKDYSNGEEITDVTFGVVTAEFDKGTSSNAPKYYTTGTAIRCYGGNTVTISAGENTITGITITFGTGDGTNAITSNVGTYDNGTWSGSASSVTFTIGGSSGNRRFAGLSVTYTGGDTPQPTEPAVTLQEYEISVPAAGKEGILTVQYQNIDEIQADIQYYYYVGDVLTETTAEYYEWFTASIDDNNNVNYLATENESTSPRNAYFKVWALDNEAEPVYSGLVTVTQAGYVPDYATLPFKYEGGVLSDFTSLNGTSYSLNDDGSYAANNAPYRIKFTKTGDYLQVKCNEQPGNVTIGVKVFNTGSNSKITVQGSADGETFTNIEELTISASTAGVKVLETTASFDATHRYVRMLFTKGVNVGVGPITIATYEAPTEQNLTVTLGEHIRAIYVFDVADQNNPLITDGAAGTAQVTSGTSILVSPDVADGYVLESLLVNNEDVTSQMDESGAYTFIMPASAVTITATATAIPMALYSYSINGVEGATLQTPVGSTITLAAGTNLNNDFTFAGWTTNPNDVSQLLTSFTFDEEDTYVFYAVYEHTTGIATSASMTIDKNTENFPTSYGTANTFTEYTLNDKKFQIQQVYYNSNNGTDCLQFRASGNNNGTGIIYNAESFGSISSIVLTYNSNDNNKNFTIKAGLTANPTEGTAITPSINENEYTFDLSGGNYSYFVLTNGDYAGYLDNIIINYTAGPTAAYYTRVFLGDHLNFGHLQYDATSDIEIVGPSIVPSNHVLSMGFYALSNDVAANLIIEDGGQVSSMNEDGGKVFAGTMLKNITACDYNPSNNAGYYLIATPIEGFVPAANNGFITTDYDLYDYDATKEDEWVNFKQTGNFSTLLGYHGYLYASGQNTTLRFEGLLNDPSMNDDMGGGYVELNYAGGDDAMKDLTLVGNSGTAETTFSMYDDSDNQVMSFNFLTLNDTGDGFISNVDEEMVEVAPLDAVFVQAPGAYHYMSNDDQILSFSANNRNVNVKVSRENGDLLDNAIVSFGGSMMKKLYLTDNSTRVYFPISNQDYAVVRVQSEGDQPVNFKAKENGTYTLNIETKNIEMEYLHLIDNMTGADVDLLTTPSYTFEAKTSDYASRFRLVFNANNTDEDGASTGSATFAYFNGSNWTISNMGEATLQVVDVMGRVLSSETLSGNAEVSINQPTGVYMLRLVSGDSVKVQKVVVR